MADEHAVARENRLYLLLSAPQEVNRLNVAVTKKILDNGCKPLVISLNQPGRVISKTYAKAGILPEMYYVVDAVTRYSGGEMVPMPQIRYVNHPADLTGLGIAVTETLKAMPPVHKCILFDSLSLLLIHTPTITAAKFLHFLINNLRLAETSGIILSADVGIDPVILSQISTFVDSIITFDKMR
ncbi:MAG: hypothetical protein WC367_01975 [Methanoregula sp.]